MPGRKHQQRQQLIIADRRSRVMGLRLDGYTHREIAEKLSVSNCTVSKDLAAVMNDLRDEAVADMKALERKQLLALDRVIRRATEGWQRSLEPEVTVQKTDAEHDGVKETKTVATRKPQCGNPQFLTVYLNAVAQKTKILGLEAPEKADVNVRVPLDFDALTGRSENPSNVVDGKIVKPSGNGSNGNGNGQAGLPPPSDK